MKFSDAYRSYQALREPSYQLTVGASTLKVSEDAHLRSLRCELSCESRAGSLNFEVELDESGKNSAAWLKALVIGASVTLALGYNGSHEIVFCGFILELRWTGSPDGSILLLEVECLDVLAKLMQSTHADAGSTRKVSALVSEVFGQSCCTAIAKTRTIGTIPNAWDVPWQRLGATDFEVIADIADFLCFEFYAFADELYFGKPRPESTAVFNFDGPNGLIQIEQIHTLSGQTSSITILGADDKGERLSAKELRPSDNVSKAIQGEFVQCEPFVRTMEQAKFLAKARIKQIAKRAKGLHLLCTGLPQLRPGRLIELSGLNSRWNGSYYMRTVTHVLDETGFETELEAEG